jgi:hypothetical protein
MTDAAANAADNTTKSMDDIMALCKRRGFIFQASEIYGGIQGFWDYGPLGAQLKKNLRDAWWNDVVMLGCNGQNGPDGKPVRIVPVDSCIIQNPKVWEASGHVAGFNDPMVDCRETKSRYRADHLMCIGEKGDKEGQIYAYIENDDASYAAARKKLDKYKKRTLGDEEIDTCALTDLSADELKITVGPDAKEVGTLTEPRAFNLMFDTIPAHPQRGQQGLPPPRDRPGHLHQLQERGRHHPRRRPVRHRPDGQGLPQRGHARATSRSAAASSSRWRSSSSATPTTPRRGTPSGATGGCSGGRTWASRATT